MRGKRARQLRKLAVEAANGSSNEMTAKMYQPKRITLGFKDKLKSFIINPITRRYKPDSPRSIYKILKREWVRRGHGKN